MILEDQYRCFIRGYFGIMEMDSYDLKVYVLRDIEQYIREFIRQNPSSSFQYEKEVAYIKEKISLKRKLQDALLILNKIEAPMELIFLIKRRLKDMQGKE